MGDEVLSIESFDGFVLPYRFWMPVGENLQAIILAIHGFNDHSGFCRSLAPELTKAGAVVFAYDQRSFGQTEDDGFWPGENRLVGDLLVFSDFLRRRWPDVPLVVMGESMGAAVAILAATDSPKEGGGKLELPAFAAERLVLSAPGVWARHLQPWHHQIALGWMRSVMPGISLPCNLARKMIAESSELLEDLKNDPLVRKQCSVEKLAGVVDMMGKAWGRGPLLARPTLILQGMMDDVIPASVVSSFWDSIPYNSENRLLLYRKGRHMLWRDCGGEDAPKDIHDWIVHGGVEEFSSRDRDVIKPLSERKIAMKIDLNV